MRITISKGNSKMGAIPSVSLPPITTCAAGCTCAKKCYAAKLCRIYPSVKKSYENNLAAYLADPKQYFDDVTKAACMSRAFRWHVAGDIPDEWYFANMIAIAKDLPDTVFLCFTKQYDIVNGVLNVMEENGIAFPQNFKLLLSPWPGMEMRNPHNLPEAHVIFKGQEPAPDWKICGGNCTECRCLGVGCWELKKGEKIAFYEH